MQWEWARSQTQPMSTHWEYVSATQNKLKFHDVCKAAYASTVFECLHKCCTFIDVKLTVCVQGSAQATGQ